MKTLTVETIESISQDIQRDIHYSLKMEHYTDYIFKDEGAAQYSVTISMDDTKDVIKKIVEYSALIPDYTIVLDNLDMESNRIEHYTVQNGEIIEKKEESPDS